ncbi:hypothetical protein PMIN04_007510 [Paraphaeosphaeria minitans]
MSAGSPPFFVEVESYRPSVIKHLAASSANAQRLDDHDTDVAAPPRLGITRHYTSLWDHAITVHNAKLTPGGGQGSSPRVEGRQEGVTWETERVDEPRRANYPSPHMPQTPPTLEELSRADSKPDIMEDGRPKNPKSELLSRASTKELSIIDQRCCKGNEKTCSGLAHVSPWEEERQH